MAHLEGNIEEGAKSTCLVSALILQVDYFRAGRFCPVSDDAAARAEL